MPRVSEAAVENGGPNRIVVKMTPAVIAFLLLRAGLGIIIRPFKPLQRRKVPATKGIRLRWREEEKCEADREGLGHLHRNACTAAQYRIEIG